MIRRVTTYDGALLEQAHPAVHDVVQPDVARTMTAMLEDVVKFGTGYACASPGPPGRRKDRHHQRFHRRLVPRLHPAVDCRSLGRLRRQSGSLGKPETGAVAALPIWLEFMQGALAGKPVEDFPNVVPLEKVALTKTVKVDTPDSAPTEAAEEPTSHDAPAGTATPPGEIAPAPKTPPNR